MSHSKQPRPAGRRGTGPAPCPAHGGCCWGSAGGPSIPQDAALGRGQPCRRVAAHPRCRTPLLGTPHPLAELGWAGICCFPAGLGGARESRRQPSPCRAGSAQQRPGEDSGGSGAAGAGQGSRGQGQGDDAPVGAGGDPAHPPGATLPSPATPMPRQLLPRPDWGDWAVVLAGEAQVGRAPAVPPSRTHRTEGGARTPGGSTWRAVPCPGSGSALRPRSSHQGPNSSSARGRGTVRQRVRGTGASSGRWGQASLCPPHPQSQLPRGSPTSAQAGCPVGAEQTPQEPSSAFARETGASSKRPRAWPPSGPCGAAQGRGLPRAHAEATRGCRQAGSAAFLESVVEGQKSSLQLCQNR